MVTVHVLRTNPFAHTTEWVCQTLTFDAAAEWIAHLDTKFPGELVIIPITEE